MKSKDKFEKESGNKIYNPIPELIEDKAFEKLVYERLIDDKGLRNYQIRKEFTNLRDQKFSVGDAIERLQMMHQYLEFDTLRKIVYCSKSYSKHKEVSN